jgi:hypothetical protein
MEAERRVGDHVDPRRGRGRPVVEDRHVLVAAVGEAAEPVPELELGSPRGDRLLRGPGRAFLRDRTQLRQRHALRHLDPLELLREAAAPGHEHRARRGLQQVSGLGRDLIGAQDEHAAEHRVRRRTPPRLARANERVERVLQLLEVRARAFVQDHQVDREVLRAPVLVRADELARDAQVAGLVDLHQHDRQVARDAERPELCRAALVAPLDRRRRAQSGIPEDDVVRELLEEPRLVGLDPEVVQIDLRSGQAGVAARSNAVASQLLVDRVEAPRAWARPASEAQPNRSARGHAALAQAEDGIEHRSRGVREAGRRRSDGTARVARVQKRARSSRTAARPPSRLRRTRSAPPSSGAPPTSARRVARAPDPPRTPCARNRFEKARCAASAAGAPARAPRRR